MQSAASDSEEDEKWWKKAISKVEQVAESIVRRPSSQGPAPVSGLTPLSSSQAPPTVTAVDASAAAAAAFPPASLIPGGGGGTSHLDNPNLVDLKQNLARCDAFLSGRLQPYDIEDFKDTGKAKVVRAMAAVRYSMSAVRIFKDDYIQFNIVLSFPTYFTFGVVI